MNYSDKIRLRGALHRNMEVIKLSNEIAIKLGKFVQDTDYSIRTIAFIANVNEKTIRDVLKGDGNITVNSLHKICGALGLSLSEFFDGIGFSVVSEVIKNERDLK